jgi:dienelactone hydrolase
VNESVAAAPLERVDQMNGPILALWGDQDMNVDQARVAQFVAALETRNLDIQAVLYPGIGHSFMSASRLEPNAPAFEASCDAWTRTIDFYRQQLADLRLAEVTA